MVKYVYTPDVAPEWPGHVFPVEKYRLIMELLERPTVRPEPATDGELLLVHTRAYLDLLESLTQAPELGERLFEAPCTRRTVDAFRFAAGGTILASRLALDHRAAANVGGGFHHAFADRGEGFCLINDIAVAIRVLQKEGRLRRAAVVDLDLHQGNGTARIFAGDPSVFTFSMHQEHLYPLKEPSSLDIGLAGCTRDEEYLDLLSGALPQVIDSRPDLVVYQAGADPYVEDKLGSLELTKEGLSERDRRVFEACRGAGIPAAVTLGGGYANRVEDVVEIHLNTLRRLEEVYG